MADAVSMDDIVLEVRRLANQETTDQANAFMTDVEIASRANKNLRKVYLALVRARGGKYFQKAAPDFATVNAKDEYDLPTDFLELLTVSRQVGNSEWEPLVDFNDMERHAFDWQPARSLGAPLLYQLQANKIVFTPIPTGGETIRIKYVPSYTPIAGVQKFDGIAGFEEWAIWETVSEALAKDDANYELALMKMKWWEDEVESMARRRDRLMPQRIQRVRKLRKYGWPR